MALMISIGRQTGPCEAVTMPPPPTSSDITRAAGLHERYARERLGAMVTGGTVEYEPGTETCAPPPEHAAALANAAGPRNLARFRQFISLLAEVEADIIESFRNGGGGPYAKYPCFQAVMAEACGLRFDHMLVDKIVPLAGIGDSLSRGVAVLENGCGNRHAVSNSRHRSPPANPGPFGDVFTRTRS